MESRFAIIIARENVVTIEIRVCLFNLFESRFEIHMLCISLNVIFLPI